MRLPNSDQGYGLVSKVLHWATVVAVAAQFALGLSMEADSAEDRAKDRADAIEERAEGQGEAAEERAEAEADRVEEAAESLDDAAGSRELDDVVSGTAFGDGLTGVEAHVLLGLTIIVLALARIGWRRVAGLPPWAEHLGAGERRLEGTLEKALLTLLLVVPASGLVLALGGEGLLPLHIAAQLALLAAVAVHVGLVLKHTVLQRHRHLSRML